MLKNPVTNQPFNTELSPEEYWLHLFDLFNTELSPERSWWGLEIPKAGGREENIPDTTLPPPE